MQLVKRDNRFVAVCGYDMRQIPKDAGFRWDPATKQWWTDKADKAAKLARYATPDVRQELSGSVATVVETAREAVAQSHATDDTSIEIPCPPGLAYLPYQRAGIAYASARPAALIGDDMGLGKTIQAIGVANLDPSIKSVLIICPASLKLNWAREWAKWSTRESLITIAQGTKDQDFLNRLHSLVLLQKEKGYKRPQNSDNLPIGTNVPVIEVGVSPDASRIQVGLGRVPDARLTTKIDEHPLDQPNVALVDANSPTRAPLSGPANRPFSINNASSVSQSRNIRGDGDIVGGSFPDGKLVSGSVFDGLVMNTNHESHFGISHPGLNQSNRFGNLFRCNHVFILNYDVVQHYRSALDKVQIDLLITDEAHALKNGKAIRTKQILGGGGKKTAKVEPIRARRRVFMTGTPILNRPSELWTLVHALDPQGLGANYIRYHMRYCAGFQTKWGWDFTGASNLDELQRRLRESIMIRRLKSEVLTDLPAKRRQVIELAVDDAGGIVRAEQAAWDAQEEILERARLAVLQAEADGNEDAYQAAVSALRSAKMVAFTGMSKTRHDTAVAKIPAIIEHLEEAIEASGKVVFFAHHLDVLAQVAKAFEGAAVVLVGDTKQLDRQAAVDRFQSDPTCKLFVGGILPAGVGITLTAAAHVVFGEIDWRPGIVTQAEDRCHRIGQVNSVLVQHLVIDGSLDATMSKRIVAKQEVIDAALDNRAIPSDDDDVVIGLDEAEPAPAPLQAPPEARHDRAPIVVDLSPAQIEAIHAGLRLVASFDTDHAREVNGVGFSKIDGEFGHSLASASRLTARQASAGLKLCRKYRRQIGDELMREITQ